MERELQDEVILDLPALLALCLRKGIWILLVTVLCGLAIPSFKLYKAMQSQNAESLKTEEENGDANAAMKAKEKELALKYASNERKRQESLLLSEREALAHSVLMQIDPSSYGERDISLYFALEEGETSLNERELAIRLSTVTQAYSKALQSGGFYRELAKELGGKLKEKDVEDLIYVSGNERSGILTIYLVGRTEKPARELGDALLAYLEKTRTALEESLPAHRMEVLSDTLYTAKSSGLNQEGSQDKEAQAFPLLSRQQKKIDAVESRSAQVTEWKKKEKEAKGEEVLGTQGISKKTLLRYGILGIFLGGFLSVAAITLPFLFTKELPREEDLEMSYGLMILGSKKRYKKQGLFPKWGAKLSGEEGRCENEEELFKLVKANLCLLAKEKGIQEELLLVGAKAEMGAKLLSALQEESSLSLRLAEDILQSPEGIQALSNHKYIVMAYSAKTDLLSLLKSKKKAEALGKEVLGLVIY